MTQHKRSIPILRAFRYIGVFAGQLFENAWYIYYIAIGIMLLGGFFQAHHALSWAMVILYVCSAGCAGIAMVVGRIDRAFQTLPISYSPEYGVPRWIVRGKYPLRQETLRISAAGLSTKDFESHLDKISSRLCQPIREVRKPDTAKPVILVELGESKIPDRLRFDELPWEDLKSGHFFVGRGEKELISLHLSEMVHMLVAGQTGMGKTAFERQFLATVLSKTRQAHALVLDMKGGVDFHQFSELPNFELAIEPEPIIAAIDDARHLVELRKKYLAEKKKQHWNELSLKDLEKEPAFNGKPIGNVLIIVDELAELVYQMPNKKQSAALQSKLSTFPRLSRSTSIHLIVGTQRPDKRILDGQSKDNLGVSICFSVPSVQASTLVVGDKSASTLGAHPGRAVYRRVGSQVIQTPYFEKSDIETLLGPLAERLKQSRYDRNIRGITSVGHENSIQKGDMAR